MLIKSSCDIWKMIGVLFLCWRYVRIVLQWIYFHVITLPSCLFTALVSGRREPLQAAANGFTEIVVQLTDLVTGIKQSWSPGSPAVQVVEGTSTRHLELPIMMPEEDTTEQGSAGQPAAGQVSRQALAERVLDVIRQGKAELVRKRSTGKRPEQLIAEFAEKSNTGKECEQPITKHGLEQPFKRFSAEYSQKKFPTQLIREMAEEGDVIVHYISKKTGQEIPICLSDLDRRGLNLDIESFKDSARCSLSDIDELIMDSNPTSSGSGMVEGQSARRPSTEMQDTAQQGVLQLLTALAARGVGEQEACGWTEPAEEKISVLSQPTAKPLTEKIGPGHRRTVREFEIDYEPLDHGQAIQAMVYDLALDLEKLIPMYKKLAAAAARDGELSSSCEPVEGTSEQDSDQPITKAKPQIVTGHKSKQLITKLPVEVIAKRNVEQLVTELEAGKTTEQNPDSIMPESGTAEENSGYSIQIAKEILIEIPPEDITESDVEHLVSELEVRLSQNWKDAAEENPDPTIPRPDTKKDSE